MEFFLKKSFFLFFIFIFFQSSFNAFAKTDGQIFEESIQEMKDKDKTIQTLAYTFLKNQLGENIPSIVDGYLKEVISHVLMGKALNSKISLSLNEKNESVLKVQSLAKIENQDPKQSLSHKIGRYDIIFNNDPQKEFIIPNLKVNHTQKYDAKEVKELELFNYKVYGDLFVGASSSQEIIKKQRGEFRSLLRADPLFHPHIDNIFSENHAKQASHMQNEVIHGLLQIEADSLLDKTSGPLFSGVLMPVGSGKTVTSALYFKKLQDIYLKNKIQNPQALKKDMKIVFIVENNRILEDAIKTFSKIYKVDPTQVIQMFGGSKLRDYSNDQIKDAKLFFASRSSFYAARNQMFEVMKEEQDSSWVVIFDEAQHVGTHDGQIDDLLKKLKNTLVKKDRIFYMSATLFHDDQNIISSLNGKIVAPFLTARERADLINGENLHSIVQKQLFNGMAQGYISPLFQYHSLVYKDIEQLPLILKNIEYDQNKKIKNLIYHQKLIQKVYLEIQTQKISRIADRGIIFVPTIDHANLYVTEFNKLSKGNGQFEVYHSQIAPKEKTRVFSWFKNSFNRRSHRYLIVIDGVNEGVDFPDSNLLINLRINNSFKSLVQNFGRVLRVSLFKSDSRMIDVSNSFIQIISSAVENGYRYVFNRPNNPKDPIQYSTNITVNGEPLQSNDFSKSQVNFLKDLTTLLEERKSTQISEPVPASELELIETKATTTLPAPALTPPSLFKSGYLSVNQIQEIYDRIFQDKRYPSETPPLTHKSPDYKNLTRVLAQNLISNEILRAQVAQLILFEDGGATFISYFKACRDKKLKQQLRLLAINMHTSIKFDPEEIHIDKKFPVISYQLHPKGKNYLSPWLVKNVRYDHVLKRALLPIMIQYIDRAIKDVETLSFEERYYINVLFNKILTLMEESLEKSEVKDIYNNLFEKVVLNFLDILDVGVTKHLLSFTNDYRSRIFLQELKTTTAEKLIKMTMGIVIIGTKKTTLVSESLKNLMFRPSDKSSPFINYLIFSGYTDYPETILEEITSDEKDLIDQFVLRLNQDDPNQNRYDIFLKKYQHFSSQKENFLLKSPMTLYLLNKTLFLNNIQTYHFKVKSQRESYLLSLHRNLRIIDQLFQVYDRDEFPYFLIESLKESILNIRLENDKIISSKQTNQEILMRIENITLLVDKFSEDNEVDKIFEKVFAHMDFVFQDSLPLSQKSAEKTLKQDATIEALLRDELERGPLRDQVLQVLLFEEKGQYLNNYYSSMTNPEDRVKFQEIIIEIYNRIRFSFDNFTKKYSITHFYSEDKKANHILATLFERNNYFSVVQETLHPIILNYFQENDISSTSLMNETLSVTLDNLPKRKLNQPLKDSYSKVLNYFFHLHISLLSDENKKRSLNLFNVKIYNDTLMSLDQVPFDHLLKIGIDLMGSEHPFDLSTVELGFLLNRNEFTPFVNHLLISVYMRNVTHLRFTTSSHELEYVKKYRSYFTTHGKDFPNNSSKFRSRFEAVATQVAETSSQKNSPFLDYAVSVELYLHLLKNDRLKNSFNTIRALSSLQYMFEHYSGDSFSLEVLKELQFEVDRLAHIPVSEHDKMYLHINEVIAKTKESLCLMRKKIMTFQESNPSSFMETM